MPKELALESEPMFLTAGPLQGPLGHPVFPLSGVGTPGRGQEASQTPVPELPGLLRGLKDGKEQLEFFLKLGTRKDTLNLQTEKKKE